MYLRFLIWLHSYSDFPGSTRWFAMGLYQLLWSHWCGYGWKSGWRGASLYWFQP